MNQSLVFSNYAVSQTYGYYVLVLIGTLRVLHVPLSVCLSICFSVQYGLLTGKQKGAEKPKLV